MAAHRLFMHAQAPAATACCCAGMQQHCHLGQLLSARPPALQPCMRLLPLRQPPHTSQRIVVMEAGRLFMHAQAPAPAACRCAGMQQHCRLGQLLPARPPALQPCMQLPTLRPTPHTPQRSVWMKADRLFMHAQAPAAAACRCAGTQQHCRLGQLLSARPPALQPCMQLPPLRQPPHTPQRSVGMAAHRLLMHVQAPTAAACRCAGIQQHCSLGQLLSARPPALQPGMQLPTLHPTPHTPHKSVGM